MVLNTYPAGTEGSEAGTLVIGKPRAMQMSQTRSSIVAYVATMLPGATETPLFRIFCCTGAGPCISRKKRLQLSGVNSDIMKRAETRTAFRNQAQTTLNNIHANRNPRFIYTQPTLTHASFLSASSLFKTTGNN